MINNKLFRKELTVLSFGAGQDSTDLLYRIILYPEFRRKYVKGDFIVVMSDTGNEHPHTYEHIEYIKRLCIDCKIEFYFLTLGEYHPRTWPTLVSQFQRNNSIMSLAGPRSCTDNLKIKPIYNFLDHYIACRYFDYGSIDFDRYNHKYILGGKPPVGKKYITRFAEEEGRVNVIIGIAAGEESRIKKASKREKKAMQTNAFAKWRNPVPKWFRKGINKLYPLVEEQISRWEIHDHITQQTSFRLPYPSNCMFCPYMTKIEILWLYRNYRGLWNLWVELEENKIKKCEGNGKRNLGVKGEKLLPEFLQEAIKEFGHMTDEEINEHKMSHGHCVMSTY